MVVHIPDEPIVKNRHMQKHLEDDISIAVNPGIGQAHGGLIGQGWMPMFGDDGLSLLLDLLM